MAKAESLERYRAKRDFTQTAEPAPKPATHRSGPASFVVQKHFARRLHWDFRLEHGGVLWSWAVPKGPSMDPADKRLAVHVEDHPLDYAGFAGEIPAGNYGAGTVEIWDRGTWAPLGDAAADLAAGEMKFILQGSRLAGGFVLIRLKGKPAERAENWLLIKEHDAQERAGAGADVLESMPVPSTEPAEPQSISMPENARRGKMPVDLKPQLATLSENAPTGDGWISEVKFDGYRILAYKDGPEVRLITRNGLDWTARLPSVARAIAALPVETAVVDGELVALAPDGRSSFPALQQALSAGTDKKLSFYAFDLPYLQGFDLRRCRLDARKATLRALNEGWSGVLRFSDHLTGEAVRVRREACTMGLEGIVCKRADASYTSTRGRSWLKVKCLGREEFIVLGWTPPGGARTGLGSLHVGFHDARGTLHYAGGVGTGFTDDELTRLTALLKPLAAGKPGGLVESGEPIDKAIRWVRPEIVTEVQFAGWSGGGRLRHATYLGIREDKTPDEVIFASTPDAAPEPTPPPVALLASQPKRPDAPRSVIVHATKPKPKQAEVAGVAISHPDRQLWPGLTKLDLAKYWQSILPWATPAVLNRPLALVRCPDGVGGSQQFFQKHAMPGQQPAVHASSFEGHPYLFVDGAPGLAALSQMAAIELHSWGAACADPGRPDRVVFDLDPGEGVAWPDVVAAAHDVRARLDALGLTCFCRTTGGKGLHVVVPLQPGDGWEVVRPWCQAFARVMEAQRPEAYLSTLPKVKRRGKILVDWLRNGLGSTAIASFSPRARPGATAAVPITWAEVTDALDPAAFTITTVPDRLQALKRDPWDGFDAVRQTLPNSQPAAIAAPRRATIVHATAPKKRKA